jgi:single-strand DNA-binding protein
MADHPSVNDVLLVGRLSGDPLLKTLPSGDLILTWRLVVERPPGVGHRTTRKVVDTLNCVSFDGRLRDIAQEWRHGDMLEVSGAVRRRFWRTGSTYEIAVERAQPCTQRPVDGGDAVPDD